MTPIIQAPRSAHEKSNGGIFVADPQDSSTRWALV
jgi:hypothetical protein